jgi:hypothetical protein
MKRVRVTRINFPPGELTFLSIHKKVLTVSNCSLAEAMYHHLQNNIEILMPPEFSWEGWHVFLETTSEERQTKRFTLPFTD